MELCWTCAGDERLTERQRRYLESVRVLGLREYPHCDDKVLHARGDCRYCSLAQYERLHALRAEMSIAHSGAMVETDQDPCPSEAYRPADIIERWPGNRAAPA